MKEEFTDAHTHAQTNEWMDKWTDERMHDGHNAMTIAHWPSASGANKTCIFKIKGEDNPGAIGSRWLEKKGSSTASIHNQFI